MERYTLSANERIKNSEEITTLIRKGQAFFLAPFKVYYSWTPIRTKPFVRVAFAVPKKKFSKAVMRNKLKRLSREGFRLQKSKLQELAIEKEHELSILFMYQKTQVLSCQEIHTAIGASIEKIIEKDG